MLITSVQSLSQSCAMLLALPFSQKAKVAKSFHMFLFLFSKARPKAAQVNDATLGSVIPCRDRHNEV